MKRPALFFDRDNTLLISDGYLSDPGAVTLVQGAADAVARARALGFSTVIFSNQSGVARGMFDEAAVEAINARLDELLTEKNPEAIIDRHEYCPYHPDAALEHYRIDSDLRKPKPGMIFKAADALDLDLEKSWVIGDAPRDIAAGQAAGCRTILFTDPTLPPSAAASEELASEPDARVGTLKGAVDFIESSLRQVPIDSAADSPSIGQMYADDSPASSDSIATPMEQAPPQETPAEPQMPASTDIPPAAAPAPTVVQSLDVNAMASAFARETALLINASQPAPSPPAHEPPSTAHLEKLMEQCLVELKRSREPHPPDFSVSKLLAGIVQIAAVATLVSTYFLHMSVTAENMLMLSIALQTLTIALLIMGKQS